MADSLKAKWPVSELSAIENVNDRGYLTADVAAGLYETPYSTFVKQLKDFVKNGEYPGRAFRVERFLGSPKREYWKIGIHPILGIRALNKHFFPRLIGE